MLQASFRGTVMTGDSRNAPRPGRNGSVLRPLDVVETGL